MMNKKQKGNKVELKTKETKMKKHQIPFYQLYKYKRMIIRALIRRVKPPYTWNLTYDPIGVFSIDVMKKVKNKIHFVEELICIPEKQSDYSFMKMVNILINCCFLQLKKKR